VVELFTMWRSTRMVVLTAVSAALYASILIPFKFVPLIPGVTELRPASAVPVVCSFLFGPAGAWGAAFGNAIGELFGGLGPGDFFGFVGNLALGFVPYAMWEACTDAPPDARTPRNVAALVAVIAVASVLCATIIGWGLNLLGFHPFRLMASVVMLNSTLVSLPLGPLLLRVLYPRLAKAQLLYRDVLGPRRRPPRARRLLGVALIVVGTMTAFAAGWSVASGWWVPSWVPWQTPRASVEVGVGVLPFLAIVVLGCALL
jgi:energy-coupling factor transport system substrate-specific component